MAYKESLLRLTMQLSDFKQTPIAGYVYLFRPPNVLELWHQDFKCYEMGSFIPLSIAILYVNL